MFKIRTVVIITALLLTGLSNPSNLFRYHSVVSPTLHASELQGRHLVISELRLIPNPFTPYSVYNFPEEVEGQGLRISFKVATEARFVWITCKIYNTRGNLVRTITELEPVYSDRGANGSDEPTDIVLWWDGLTDYNRPANNGRYIFHLKVSDSEAETFYKEKMATVVLIK